MEMDRRAMLAALLAGGAMLGGDIELEAQQAHDVDQSLYTPKAQLVEDRRFLHDFMDRFAFVSLVTTRPTLRITHIPTVLDRTTGEYGTIFGHVSAQNPQGNTFDGAHTAVMVFRGPQGYISSSWYAKPDVVPTWNFAVVHASGRPKAITDHDKAHALLSSLIKKFEASVGSTSFHFEKLPENYVNGLMRGITPFSMEIEALEGKFKLGQERSDADRQGILAHLQKDEYREPSLFELTDAFYKRPRS